MSLQRPKQHSTTIANPQAWETNTRTSPVGHQRTSRRHDVNVVTSAPGGKLVPLAAVPLLREDGANNGSVTVNVQMSETVKMLLNPVRISVAAYLVPKLAFERFADMGSIDRSYAGQPEIDGNTIDWFLKKSTISEIEKVMGLHKPAGAGNDINLDYVEAYNAVWNYVAENRSPSLTKRNTVTAYDLGPAFWPNTALKHVVPTFDAAMMDGTVPLTFADSKVPVRTEWGNQSQRLMERDTGNYIVGDNMKSITAGQGIWRMDKNGSTETTILLDPNNTMFAELEDSGVTVSLANIGLARETAAWARLRTQYQGKSEEWMMDQLLAGIRLNDDALKQPMLLDTREAVVGMVQRYASDSGNLTDSVTDGRTSVSLNIRTPAIQCGGVIMIVAQALPEQIYERQEDAYLYALDVNDLPNRISDELDPQPVTIKKNKQVDAAHSQPEDLFGYQPLNAQWAYQGPKIGGRYYRPDPNAVSPEDRNRIWDTGVIDPALGPDFYLATSLQQDVFADTVTDPFEFWVGGSVNISGLTYFGPKLRESQGDYEAVLGKVPTDRLSGDGTDTLSSQIHTTTRNFKYPAGDPRNND